MDQNVISSPVIRWILDRFKVDVLVNINSGNRDALGLLLVAVYLREKYHLKVAIRSTTDNKTFWLYFLRPTVTVSIWIDCQPAIDLYRRVKDLGTAAIVSPTEVVAWSGVQNFVGRYPYKDLIKSMLISGVKMADLLVDNQKLDRQQAKIVGYPTLDWCHKPLRTMWLTRKEFINTLKIPKNRKIIFIASSFSMADMTVDRWGLNWKNTREEFQQMIDISINMRNISVKAIKQLLQTHPKWHAVIKKHPSEKAGYYESEFDNHPQVKVVNEMDIHDLLNNADVLVHWNSTTSVQAWAFGVPTILLDFPENDLLPSIHQEELADFRKGNYRARSIAELENELIKCLSNETIPEAQQKHRDRYIGKWFFSLDGKSYSRAAKCIYDQFMEERNRKIKYLLRLSDFIWCAPIILKYYFWLAVYNFITAISPAVPIWIQAKTVNKDLYYIHRHRKRFEKKLVNMIRQGLI